MKNLSGAVLRGKFIFAEIFTVISEKFIIPIAQNIGNNSSHVEKKETLEHWEQPSYELEQKQIGTKTDDWNKKTKR